jgi:hypothetical protein
VVGAKINRINAIGQLAEKLGIHRLIFGRGYFSLGETALIGDDNREPASGTEFLQEVRRTRINTHVVWIIAVIHLLHERAVAVEKDGASLRHRFERNFATPGP